MAQPKETDGLDEGMPEEVRVACRVGRPHWHAHVRRTAASNLPNTPACVQVLLDENARKEALKVGCGVRFRCVEPSALLGSAILARRRAVSTRHAATPYSVVQKPLDPPL
jgi:hypothetical protein